MIWNNYLPCPCSIPANILITIKSFRVELELDILQLLFTHLQKYICNCDDIPLTKQLSTGPFSFISLKYVLYIYLRFCHAYNKCLISVWGWKRMMDSNLGQNRVIDKDVKICIYWCTTSMQALLFTMPI